MRGLSERGSEVRHDPVPVAPRSCEEAVCQRFDEDRCAVWLRIDDSLFLDVL